MGLQRPFLALSAFLALFSVTQYRGGPTRQKPSKPERSCIQKDVDACVVHLLGARGAKQGKLRCLLK